MERLHHIVQVPTRLYTYRNLKEPIVFNCADIDECESDDLNNCHENAQCTNTEGSFTCSCNPGYTGDGVTCTSKEGESHAHILSCTKLISFLRSACGSIFYE